MASLSQETIAAGAFALAGVVLGGLIAFVTASVTTSQQISHDREERRITAAAGRKDRAAQIIGRVNVFVASINPSSLAGEAMRSPDFPATVATLQGRLETLREELAIFAAGDEDDAVADAATRLQWQLYSAFQSCLAHAQAMRDKTGEDHFKVARYMRFQALWLSRVVLDRVRGRDDDAAAIERLVEAIGEWPDGKEVDALESEFWRLTSGKG